MESWHLIFLKFCIDATSINEKTYQSNQNISQLYITYTCTSKHTKKQKSLTVLTLQLHIYLHFGKVKMKINRVYLEKSIHRKPKRDSIDFECFTLNPFACNAYGSLTSYTMYYSPMQYVSCLYITWIIIIVVIENFWPLVINRYHGSL